jgi:hypothetical protein
MQMGEKKYTHAYLLQEPSEFRDLLHGKFWLSDTPIRRRSQQELADRFPPSVLPLPLKLISAWQFRIHLEAP